VDRGPGFCARNRSKPWVVCARLWTLFLKMVLKYTFTGTQSAGKNWWILTSFVVSFFHSLFLDSAPEVAHFSASRVPAASV
jgi:hypothetical protein